MLLISIPFSHYNEKARWALDLYGVNYKTKRYLPFIHVWGVKHHCKTTAEATHRSSPYTTPVLKLNSGNCLHGSTAILHYLSQQNEQLSLYPNNEVEPLENYFDEQLGPEARRMAYYYSFRDKQYTQQFFRHNVSKIQLLIYKIFSSRVSKNFKHILQLNPKRIKQSHQQVDTVFNKVAKLLSDGRSFLTGEQFTAADISFAALAAPILGIRHTEGYGAWIPPIEQMPADFQALIKAYRQTPAGQFALRLYREQRQQTKPTS